MPALSPDEDAYGRAMLDHLDGLATWEIVERDDGFFSPGAGPALYFSEFPEWRTMEKQAMQHVAGRVLDVGCGAGRFMLYLREHGHDIVGIDNSPACIEVCRRRGLDQLHVMSLDDINPEIGTFDTVLLLGGNLGLLGNSETGKDMLLRLQELTSEKGRIIGGTLDRRKTIDPDWKTYVERNLRLGRISGQARIRIRYRRFATPFFDYFRIGPDEVEGLLEGTGWALSQVISEDDISYVAIIDKT